MAVAYGAKFEELWLPCRRTGCWVWIGRVNDRGRGEFGYGKTFRAAQRASWERYRGPLGRDVRIMQSCGRPICINPEHLYAEPRSAVLVRHETTHGLTGTPEYRAWMGMRRRVLGLRDAEKKTYTDRGITVCERWSSSFQNFLDDMGRKPSPLHSLDRINNDLGYAPNNCRWATIAEQNRNRSTTKLSMEDAERVRALKSSGVPAREIAAQFGISRSMVTMIVAGQAWSA